MARIPQSEIERLKKEVSVERLVEASGIVLKKAGKDLIGLCPFHEDSTASLVVTPVKNLWHCFGCGAAGGSIDWVMRNNGVSFRHAVELLRADPAHLSLAAGTGSETAAGTVKRSLVRKLPAPVALDAGEQELLNQVIAYYHETLLASPEALAYLDKRGLGGGAGRALMERFKLGFANRTLGLRLPATRVKAGSEIRHRLQHTGILRESGHEHFNGCLVVPVFDTAGNVTEVYGRKITEGVDPPLHLYLPRPHRGVWNESGLQGVGEVILCEALMDAMTFWHAGYHNVTASYGIEGFTDDHLAAFKHYKVSRILIAYDRDEAGERGAHKVAETLMAAGIECYRLQYPKGMDANEYALKLTPATQSLGLLIRKAVWLGKGTAPFESPGQQIEDVPPEAAVSATLVTNTSPMPDMTMTSLAASPAAELSASLQKDEVKSDQVNRNEVHGNQINGDEVVMHFGERRYRVRGLAKNLSYETLKLNVLVSLSEAYYVDTFDLYAARSRTQYVLQAAKELAIREELIKLDLGKLLLKLEALQETRIKAALETEAAAPKLSAAEHQEALALLQAPDLLNRILADFATCGLVGEDTNKLVAYLAATSRKLDAPLAVVVQSSSAAGKSTLMDAVLALMPEEERVKYSAMTGQSLFYMGETKLKHKILAIAEEEGASRASYALKLLQSEGELTMASTGKDPQTGNLITQQYRVEGPVMIFLTTTAIEIDEELMNRCIILSVDEGRNQTEAIHKLQRQKRTLAGMVRKQSKDAIRTLHRNAQRLLRPLAVVNPYADQLTFLSDKTRTRRDHDKYLTLIDTIALLHQYQRPIKTVQEAGQTIEYIEVALTDIATANQLAHEVLGRSLDELSPQTRRMLLLVDHMVSAAQQSQQLPRCEIRFSRKTVRDYTGWSDFQIKTHMHKLTELEYLLPHRGGRGQCFEYELLYDGDGSTEPHLSGLLAVESLSSQPESTSHYDDDHHYDDDKVHQVVKLEDASSPQSGLKLAARCAGQLVDKPHAMGDADEVRPINHKMHFYQGNGKPPSAPSYVQAYVQIAAAETAQ